MKIKNVDLKYVLGVKSPLPDTGKPEFVLAGRSNVGKSSFINAFMNRKSYARTSSTPGKTRTVNFYSINEDFFLVDLPGYGYAATGPVEQEKWDRMIRNYLSKSGNIEEVVLLVDIRHDPTRLDVQMFNWIVSSTGFEPLVVLTKLDKIKRSQLKNSVDNARRVLGASKDCRLIPFSAESKQGLSEVYEVFDSILSGEEIDESLPTLLVESEMF